MSKYPVYGFEKPYFENIKRELSSFSDEVYYDEFDNLIIVKNTVKENTKTVLIGAYASENAFLVTDILESGEIKAVPLFKPEDSIINEKVYVGNKSGFISKKDNDFIFDFGVDNKKAAQRITKCGDTFYIKSNFESMGNSYFTNEKSYALKNILYSLMKESYEYKVVFCLFREKQKGSYALGKNLKSDYAFFLTLSDEIKDDISYLKKEKNYISEFETEKIAPYVCENYLSFADSYYLSGGCKNACGIALKYKKFENGTIKIAKNTVEKLSTFLKDF